MFVGYSGQCEICFISGVKWPFVCPPPPRAHVCLSDGRSVGRLVSLVCQEAKVATPSICLMLRIIFHNLRGRILLGICISDRLTSLQLSRHTHTHTVTHTHTQWHTKPALDVPQPHHAHTHHRTHTHIVNLSVGGFFFLVFLQFPFFIFN